jgi:pantothenate kinase
MVPQSSLAYVLVKIQPGKEQEFANYVLSKGLIVDPEVEKMNFVHGSFDFVIMLHGPIEDIERRIIEMRKSQFVRTTQTLIAYAMFTWEELSEQVKK